MGTHGHLIVIAEAACCLMLLFR